MNRVLTLAAVVALACLTVQASSVNLGPFAVDARSTFLNEGTGDPGNFNALFISLTCPNTDTTAVPAGNQNAQNAATCISGVVGGVTVLNISVAGNICFLSGGRTCISSSNQMAGIFDTNNVENAPQTTTANYNRLTGTLAAHGPGNTPIPSIVNSNMNVNNGTLSTDIANDFLLPSTGINVVVPVGATYLVIGVLDSFYGDNSGVPTVSISETNPPPVPEPATLGLIGAGLIALAALRRRRKP